MRFFTLLLAMLLCFMVPCLAASDMLQTDECKQLLKLGNEAFNEDRYDVSLDLYTKSLELADQQGDITTYTSALGSIGNLYGIFMDYERAAYYFEKGYKATLQQDERLQSIFLTNLVMCYSYTENREKTHECYDKLQLLPEWNPQLSPYYKYVGKTAISIVDKDYEAALEYTRQGMEEAQRMQLGPQYELSQHESFGVIYQQMGQLDSALYHFSIIEKNAYQKGCVELRQSSFLYLAALYRQLGDSVKSREYEIRNIMLRDTLQYGAQMNVALNRLFAYEKRANDKEVMSLHKTIDRQWMLIIFVLLIVVTLVTLSLIAFNEYKKVNSAYRLLVEKNQEQIRSLDRERILRDELQSNHAEEGAVLKVEFDEKECDTAGEASSSEDIPQENLIISVQQVHQLCEQIDAVMSDTHNISNPDFNLTLLAKLVDSNTKYVSYVINKTYQKNFKTYLNEFRIREASRRLTDPQYAHLTIQAIAEMVGFNSSSTFIIAFKRVIGMTPSVYQKIANTSNNPS